MCWLGNKLKGFKLWMMLLALHSLWWPPKGKAREGEEKK